MRLIDADTIWYDQLLNTGNKEHPLEWAVSRSRIDNMPTIEVVRCKDCVYCKRFNDVWYLPKSDELLCTLHVETYHTTENDYCSWGERREDGKTDNC